MLLTLHAALDYGKPPVLLALIVRSDDLTLKYHRQQQATMIQSRTALNQTVAEVSRASSHAANKSLVAATSDRLIERRAFVSSMNEALYNRIMSKTVLAANGCLIFTGSLNDEGYARIFVGDRKTGSNHYAHRVVYELLRGEIPDGEEIDHTCETRACVNIEHLEPKTHRANTLRSQRNPAALNARKAVCKRGHRFDRIRKNGGRDCNECRRVRRIEKRREVSTTSVAC